MKIDPQADLPGRGGRPNSARRFGGSIVMRMTAWYAISSFLLILIATSFLYGTVAANMKAEDRRILTNTAANLRDLLRDAASLDMSKPMLDAQAGPLARLQFIWIRVIAPDGQTQLETSGMGRALPVSDFPALMAIPPRREIIRALRTGSGQVFQTLSTRMTSRDGAGRVFEVALDASNDQHVLARYREWLMFVLPISLALCAATGFAIARNGMRPVKHIIRTTRTIHSSTLHERINPAGLPAELRSLAETFNDMLDRLEDAFVQVSQFSADVAHELRTPVNNLRGEIEVALGKPRSREEYRDVLGSALEECGRISRVIQSLLFLARAERSGAYSHFAELDVRSEIAAILEFYEPMAAEAGVTLAQDGPDGLVAAFDHTLFQQAIGNLVANAIAHTASGGSVAIRARREDFSLRIEVADTGCGIAAEHLPHIFSRFYRADRARSSASGNLGLGLAVVKSIVALHGGRIETESEIGRGTKVILTTPLTTPPAEALR